MNAFVATIIIMFSVFHVQAQERAVGPKAKNTKPQNDLHHIQKTKVVDSENVKGPKAKNTKANERLSGVEKTANPKREIMKGPKAKNKKHFIK